MGKKVARHRPAIHDTQRQFQKQYTSEDLRNCATPGCRNIIARFTKERFCSRCK